MTLVGGADTTVTGGTCYRYRLTVTDNVGNQTTSSRQPATAKVDTTAPSAPTLTLDETSPNSYADGTTLYYNPQSTNTGCFTVTATSTDAQSGIDHVGFPTVFGSEASTDMSSPYTTSYSWDNTATATGSKTVTATNGSGLTADSAFTLTPDTDAPTGQSVDLSGGPWYSTPRCRSPSTGAATPAPASTSRARPSSATRPRSRAAPAMRSAATGRQSP